MYIEVYTIGLEREGVYTVVKLTDAKIKSLKPRDKPFWESDGQGLYLFAAASGSKL